MKLCSVHNNWLSFTRNLLLGLFFTFSIRVAAQETSLSIWKKIILIEQDNQLSIAEKVFACEKLKEYFEENNLTKDSVYARLLHRLGALHFQLNNLLPNQQAIEFTIKAIEINNSGSKGGSPYFAVNGYSNLAIFYKAMRQYKLAYNYYDSAIISNDTKKLSNPIAIDCYVGKVLLSFRLGDYQKCIEDCTKGILHATLPKRLDILAQLYNQRAQSYNYFGKTNLAFADIDSARKYALMLNDNYELATEAKTRGLLQAQLHQYDLAFLSFSKSIKYRIADGDLKQIADDYTDIGNFYLKRKEYSRAIDNYNKTIYYAQKANDAERICKGYTNLGETFFMKGSAIDYKRSEQYYAKALGIFGIQQESILRNPSLQKLSSIGNIDLLFVLLSNKTELLLHLYKENNRREYLDACINTGLLMDSAITLARHEQTNENSKLYWRNSTRLFFVNILEACYLANDIARSFYFMEKSRAVLLNDKLNETAASVRLPEKEAGIEQQFKLRLVEARLQMINTDIGHNDYNRNQLKYFQVKDEFERYIQTLEQKYPAYYSYKYEDVTPSLSALQQYLKQNNETFLHYFIEDTVLYILTIDAKEARITKADKNSFHEKDLNMLLGFCSNKQMLNNRYAEFAALSHRLYNTLFAGINITPGRVIISQDNTLLPFEVLCKDESGRRFLLYEYTFSYVYSASFLLKQTTSRKATADFIGFAPVTFAPALKLPVLKNAGNALRKSATHYNDMLLLENNKAVRQSFLSKIAGYNVVSVFTHAFADSLSSEPVLFMHDSMINLSELQLLNNPATQLVILSACQTNVGRNEIGEGVYSLARGFASVGIPAVSATLWKADENAIYEISDKFNEYIAKGCRKDEALRDAKLNFLETGNKEKLLPYYWANMILIGKSDPVKLLSDASSSFLIWWSVITGIVIIPLTFIAKYFLNKKKQHYEKD